MPLNDARRDVLSLDRLPDSNLTMTQVLIANMLGVRHAQPSQYHETAEIAALCVIANRPHHDNPLVCPYRDGIGGRNVSVLGCPCAIGKHHAEVPFLTRNKSIA